VGGVGGTLLKGSGGKQGKEGGSGVGVRVRVEEGEGRRGGEVGHGGRRRGPADSVLKLMRAGTLRQGRPGTPTGGPVAIVTGGAVKTV
jgi:hypothetical protein